MPVPPTPAAATPPTPTAAPDAALPGHGDALDTIAAISTPPGRGGIGIVRIAGPAAFPIASRLLVLQRPLEHARAVFATVRDPRATEPEQPPLAPDPATDEKPAAPPPPMLDHAVVTAHHAPRSYTGDDLVEIAAHGSPVVLEAILAGALQAGARLAQPGEFTQRAFLSGRLDLLEAEAVHDLIAAHTLEQARAAAQQLGGALSRRVAPAKSRLLHLLALLEAGLDFAAGELDDVDLVPPAHITAELQAIVSLLQPLARSFGAGALLRNGASLALVGRPNAGKSSLFNRLLGRPRAIVTPVPGTTRDTVEELWSLEGVPVRLVDTAGLRLPGDAATDEAERQGIERSREALADADLVLLVHDATTPLGDDERALLAALHGRPHLLAWNKADLPGAAPAPAEGSTPGKSEDADDGAALAVSALTGEGVAALGAAILGQLRGGSDPAGSGALTTQRQYEAVRGSLAALAQAEEANANALPHELLALDLHTALQQLDQLTGQTTAEDILGRIFSTFCIGK